MTYSGNGQTTRTSAGATTYRYSLLGLASETTAGVTTYYVYDPSGGLIEEWTSSANRYFYLYDGLGSVVGLTDLSRTLVNTYRYDPYGNVVAQTGTTPNRFGFAGGYRDDTGFLKLGQRYYDPATGRWTQPAPEPASLLNPAIASAYTYVGGDPVNNVDPTGAFRRPLRKVQQRRRTSGAGLGQPTRLKLTGGSGGSGDGSQHRHVQDLWGFILLSNVYGDATVAGAVAYRSCSQWLVGAEISVCRGIIGTVEVAGFVSCVCASVNALSSDGRKACDPYRDDS